MSAQCQPYVKFSHALVLLLCFITADANAGTSNHDNSFDARYVALLHELDGSDSSTDASDSRITELSQSIQGVFGMAPLEPTSSNTPPSKPAAKDVRVHPARPQVASAKKVVAGKSLKAKSEPPSSQKERVAAAAAPKARTVEVVAVTNHTNSSAPKKNKTTAIEDAAVSLPMASFALGTPKPAANKTKKPFPGNATQKAAFESKEKFLEKQVAKLKARLSNVSASLESRKHDSSPPAKTPKPPMHALDHKPSANFMSKSPSSQTGEMQVSPELPKKAELNELPKRSRKVASALAIDSITQQETQVAQPVVQSWYSSILSWFSGSAASTPAQASPLEVEPVKIAKASKEEPKQAERQQQTALATFAESEHVIQVNDAWSAMEREDNAKIATIRGEDEAERHAAATPELPHTPTAGELKNRHGVAMSSFWSNLESQDVEISRTVQNDDLVKYAELTQAQDSQVLKASSQLAASKLKMDRKQLSSSGDDHLVAIHEPWLRREIRDKALERQIHESPDLQMIQIAHHHRRQ